MTVGRYRFGRGNARARLEDRGPADVDEILVKPPTREEHLLDRWTFLDETACRAG